MFNQYDNDDRDDARAVVPETPRDRRRFVLFGVILAVVFTAAIFVLYYTHRNML